MRGINGEPLFPTIAEVEAEARRRGTSYGKLVAQLPPAAKLPPVTTKELNEAEKAGKYDDFIRDMFVQGATDRQIAAAIGCLKPSAVVRRRLAMGLTRGRAVNCAGWEDMYKEGMTDEEIALHLGISPYPIAKRRRALGWPPNDPKRPYYRNYPEK